MSRPSENEEKVRAALMNNLKLLGLKPKDINKKFGITINKDTFKVPNHRAFQIVTNFLLRTYDPAIEDDLKKCWPITDRKDERDFRGLCYKTIRDIAKGPESNFPHVAPSMFLSPGGPQFCLLVLAFTRYIMSKAIAKDFPNESLLPLPKNQRECDVMRAATIADLEKYKLYRKDIEDVKAAYQECATDQCNAYLKTLGEKESLVNAMKENVLNTFGPVDAEGYYDKMDRMKELLLVTKSQALDGWGRIDIALASVAKSNATVENAIREPCERGVLDGNDLSSNLPADDPNRLEEHLKSGKKVLNVLDGNLDRLIKKSNLYVPKVDIPKLESNPEYEEVLTSLQKQLEELTIEDDSGDTASGGYDTGSAYKLLPPTPDFASCDFKC